MPSDAEPPDACQYCGTAQPMCLYWKMHGYVACCPECTHGRRVAKEPPEAHQTSAEQGKA
jgi:uncharacterized protein YbbK (DUF523 family)